MSNERLGLQDFVSGGTDGSVLVQIARDTGNLRNLWRMLSRQIAISNGRFVYSDTTIGARIEALKLLLGRKPLPPTIFAICEAIMRYGISEYADNKPFENNISYLPPEDELRAWGFSIEQARERLSLPGVQAGTLVLIYPDSMDGDRICMREVESGPYRGRLTTGGGRTNPQESAYLTALREAMEEAGIRSFKKTGIPFGGLLPLGVADQVVLAGEEGKGIHLERFTNYMWRFYLPPDIEVANIEPGRRWEEVSDEEITGLLEDRALTPIAECAVRALGFV